MVKSKDKMQLETLREIAHLRPRTNIIGCISRIRSNLSQAVHHFFQNLGFLYIQTPIITNIDFEDTGELFQVTTLLKKYEKLGFENYNDKLVDYSKVL